MKMSSWLSKISGTAIRLDNLENLLLQQLQDLYSAETQLVSALPKMAEAAHSPDLKTAFQNHLAETRQHKQRLERCFQLLGQEPKAEKCDAMASLISDGEEIIGLDGDPEIKDAAIIAAAQRVEHYEIAGYGCMRAFARRLGRQHVAALLQETLDEEVDADKILTEIAETSINPAATRA